MTDANAMPSRADLEAKLAERARTDDAFRAELQADPTATIRRELADLGITLSDEARVVLHEETPDTLHLVLPLDPDNQETELDDQALDLVAGGGSGESYSTCEMDPCHYL